MSGNLPSVNTNKINANAGTVTPSAQGVLAIIAPCGNSVGTNPLVANQPASFTRPNLLQAAGGEGPLVEWGAYDMNTAKLPVLAIKPSTSVAGAYGSVTKTGTGTFTPTAGSAALLADDYQYLFEVQVGGALGTPGVTYVESLDGGASFSAPKALGSALAISPAVPVSGVDTGIRITLGTSSQTLVAGDQFTVNTTGPRMSAGDLVAALEALRVSAQKWDLLLVHGETSASAVSVLDTWLSAREGDGNFRTALVNTRHKNLPVPSAESEATFAAAMAALALKGTSIRVLAGSDAGYLVSPISGVTKIQPVSLGVAARAESQALGIDPAEVDLGPIPGFQIKDNNLNPLWHDEALYPGLDALGLTTFRTFTDLDGAYVTNANLLSANGSDYVYLQHARTMNAALQVAFGMLRNFLSSGVQVNLQTGFILEPQAAKWESMVLKAIKKIITGQVSGVSFTIARDDDLSGNGPATLTCTLEVLSLKYVKTFNVTAEFVNTL